MTSLARVVWTEGMHLLPHHFQLQTQYAEASVRLAMAPLHQHPFGLTTLDIVTEPIHDGSFLLRQASGIMPDGTPFDLAEDSVPQAADLRTGFAPTDAERIVYLALAHAGAATDVEVPSDPIHDVHRFLRTEVEVFDEVTGRDERMVAVARRNLRVIVQGQPGLDRMVRLPVARIRRDGVGGFALDGEYIPTVLRIGASRRIIELLTRTLEMLEQKAVNLAEERAATDTPGPSRELMSFWLSHAIHTAIPALRGHLAMRSSHPERLHGDLARLAGALCTFSLELDAADIPLYAHDDLETCFRILDRHIRAHIDVVLPRTALHVALEPLDAEFVDRIAEGRTSAGDPGGPVYYSGTIADPRTLDLDASHWYVGVRGDLSRNDLVAGVPRWLRLCAGGENIVKLVQRSFQGLPIEHDPSPPAEISPRIGTEYFRVRARNATGDILPCAQAIEYFSTVGVYMPGVLAGCSIELRIIPPK